jgi:tetratricopeptide (TPR) repeat protein
MCAIVSAVHFNVPARGSSYAGYADTFEKGNRAYAAGKYDEALSWYEKAEKEKGVSTALLYNQGNTYYHKKEIGKCILSYERALLLEPQNADIRANLNIAQKDYGLYDPPPPWWQKAVAAMSLSQWTWLASGTLTAFSLLLLLRGIAIAGNRGDAWHVRFFHMTSLCCAALFFVAVWGVALGLHDADRAVVLQQDARLLVSPFDTAAPSASLQEGRSVTVKNAHNNYVLIQDSLGNRGWVEKSALAPLVSSDGQG